MLLAAYTFESWAAALDIPGVLYEVAPPEGVEAAGFGFAAAGLGDIDGDGVGDFAVGAPGAAAAGESPAVPGRVFVYSGATGSLIRALADGFVGFGRSLASVGDVDGDGVGDLLVGSPRHDGDALDAQPGAGAALVYSGADGSLQRLFVGQSPGGEFGHVVALLGDVNGDTLVEVLVGAPGGGPDGQGQVFIITTAQSLVPMPGSEILRVFTGEAAGDRFGEAAIPAGNSALFIGAPSNDAAGEDAGRAHLYSAADGALLLTLTGERAGDRFGTALGAGPHYSGTTVLLVGAPGHDFHSSADFIIEGSGRIYRFGTSGGLVEPDGAIHGSDNEFVGQAITPIGDIDGDGAGDFAYATSDDEELGRILLARGPGRADLILPPRFEGARDRLFGLGDIDGDGVDDLLGTSPDAQRALAASSLTIFPKDTIIGASGDLSFLFYSVATAINYAYIDGVYTPQGEISGVLASDVIRLVNNQRTIIGRVVTISGEGFAVEGTPFITVGGVRTLLPDAVMLIVGGQSPVWEHMGPVAITSDGSIIFNEQPTPHAGLRATDRAWLLRNGVLTFLWNGAARDMNDAGAVVGVGFTADEATVLLRSPDGVVTEIAGLIPNSPLRLDSAGRVYGSGESLTLSRWNAGIVTTLASAADSPPQSVPFSTIFDVSDDGRVLGQTVTTSGRSTVRTNYLFTPEDGLRAIDRFIFGTAGRLVSAGQPIRFGDDGEIATSNSILEPVEDRIVWSLREGSPFGATDGAVVGINPLGDPILLLQTGDTWEGRRILVGYAAESGVPAPVYTDILLTRQPGSGRLYAYLVAGEGTYSGQVVEGDDLLRVNRLDFAAPATPIVANATVFATSDGRVVFAGTDTAGDLVIYFDVRPFDPAFQFTERRYDNLTQTHLAARGQEFTPVASNLTGFATPWGTDHLAYLDADGEVHVVWWAPDSPLWRTNQLTTVENNGALSGTVTSFVTPWRTLHVNAFDADGQVVAAWWAPGLGGEWRTDRLAPDAARLDAATVSAFLTPWNAMNIVGLDAQTGEVTVYWWAPATNEWRVEPIVFGGGPEDFALTGELASAIGSSQSQNLFGRQDNGHVARLFWIPGDGAEWRYEDLTMLVGSA